MRRLSMLLPPATLLPNAPWMCRSPATSPPQVTAADSEDTGTEDADKKKTHNPVISSPPGPRSGDRGLLSFSGSRSRWAGTCCDGGHHVRA